MKAAYACFYLEGREDRVLRSDIDTLEIAQLVIDGKGEIHDLVKKAAAAAAEPLRVDRKKRRWIEDSAEEIKLAGGSNEDAYAHYLDGRIDELVYRLEGDVVEDIGSLISDEEPGDEDDAEDEDEEDDEDEDDDNPEGDDK